MPVQTLPVTSSLSAQQALLNRLFLSQMLQFADVVPTRGAFGGGAGEEQFASFLREEYAARLAERVQLLPDILPDRTAPAAAGR
ncbi:hypothetical protein [Alloyangia pacifica]|uniref:Flagellar protein FlgJ N-terminal domain-containing protein n=1 Tax=Alloyangia pacifica TaxID=311180 RepID=A0A1I6U081_9RHOB|nr:hypothetical protein [Alloyangia pacifica]SDH31603.1 hypothetical protein SAMN04488245_10716 [Alloyangia pacifica]SFS94794.1 hypothetical protein SAMN04488050_10716 [Alloyangia pacifica]